VNFLLRDQLVKKKSELTQTLKASMINVNVYTFETLYDIGTSFNWGRYIKTWQNIWTWQCCFLMFWTFNTILETLL